MQIIELAAKLQSVGFSEKQAKVYVAALFLGPSAVQKIAEQADVNRATAYVILDELAQMGLVSESTQGKKTVFVAEPPEAIDRYLENQATEVMNKKNELKNLLPGLKEVSRATSDGDDAPVVRFYKGEEGIKVLSSYYKRKSKVGDEIYSLTNVDEVLKINPNVLIENPKNRMRKKIASKLIYSYLNGELKSDRSILRETKKIDTPIKADLNFYKGAVVIATYRGKDALGLVIESKEIAGVLRQLFELAWKNQK